MDFMIDSNFKPWLIEINNNPCLELSCPLLAEIIPNMVENALKYCIYYSEFVWIQYFFLPLSSMKSDQNSIKIS
jgi:hypothetical protein